MKTPVNLDTQSLDVQLAIAVGLGDRQTAKEIEQDIQRSTKPAYRDRYGCSACGTGYLDCAQYALMGNKCCAECDSHPDRFTTKPAYSDEEIADMEKHYR